MVKNIAKLIILFSILFLTGCNQENNELTKEEMETIYREEVEKELEKVKEAEEASLNDKAEEEEEKATIETSNQNIESNSEKFESLLIGTQIALLTPYYDERGKPEGISEGMWSIMYGIEDNFYFIQVHSGVGSGHPLYMIERQGDTFNPVDGVTNMGISGYEVTYPPQVSVTVDELIADYESNPNLYDASAANTSPEKYDLASFNEMKAMAEETSDNFETEGVAEITEPFPDQAMFVDGVLYSGETGIMPPEEMSSAEELRAEGYEVYELTDEEFDRLGRDMNEYGITDENLLDYYLSNY